MPLSNYTEVEFIATAYDGKDTSTCFIYSKLYNYAVPNSEFDFDFLFLV